VLWKIRRQFDAQFFFKYVFTRELVSVVPVVVVVVVIGEFKTPPKCFFKSNCPRTPRKTHHAVGRVDPKVLAL
jgi:hypothetical protein